MSLSNIVNDISNKFVDLAKYAQTGRAVETFKSMDDSRKQTTIAKVLVVALAAITLGQYIPVVPVVVTVTAAVLFTALNEIANEDGQYQGMKLGDKFAQNVAACSASAVSFCKGFFEQISAKVM